MLANEYRPSTFDDFISQKYAVQFFKKVIENNTFSRTRAIWLTGPPGCSKTSLAQLVSRTTLCPNRKSGTSVGCGECDVCLGNDTSNIEHYTIGGVAEAREYIPYVKELANSMPFMVEAKPWNNYRFIILDEFELVTPELAATLLDPIEFSPATTIWIIISMDPESLARRNPIIKDAIESRCVSIPVNRFSNEDIATNLSAKLGMDWDAALTIAQLSYGNMRKAWSEVSFFIDRYELDTITSNDILRERAGGATQASRFELLKEIEAGNIKDVDRLIRQWTSSTDSITIARLLESDLLNIGTNPCCKLLGALARWHAVRSYSLTTALASVEGFSLPKEEVLVHVDGSVRNEWMSPLASKILNKPKHFFDMNGADLLSYAL